MSDSGFVFAPNPVTETCLFYYMENKYMVRYSYENNTLGFDDFVYVHNGRISFQSCYGDTAFHGRVKAEIGNGFRRVIFRFHWRANVGFSLDKMKTATLVPSGLDRDGRRHYRGYDCMGNDITLTELARTQWCSRCKAWHKLRVS